MTHLPRLERESRANSAAGKTSAKTFQRALFRATQAKKDAKKKTKQEETAFTSRRDDAWYVVAAGAVDVHVSVPGDAHGANLAGSVSEDADPLASSRSRSRAKWRGAFSKVKRRPGGEEHDAKNTARLPPRAATLRAGAFFGALDDAFAADPNATVVFVAAEPTTVLFAVPANDSNRGKTKKKKRCLTSARVRSRLSATTTTTTTTTTRATTRRRGARDAKKKMSKRASRLFSRKSSRSANATRRSWTDSPSFPPRSRRSSARF